MKAIASSAALNRTVVIVKALKTCGVDSPSSAPRDRILFLCMTVGCREADKPWWFRAVVAWTVAKRIARKRTRRGMETLSEMVKLASVK
jgi:hypothetical protein